MSVGNINNFPQSTKILKLKQPFVLIDVGARRGFHPVFNNFIPSKKVGFEPNKAECNFLNTNKSNDSEFYFPVGLGSKYEERTFYNLKNPGSSGIFPPDKEYWSRFADSNSLDIVSVDIIETEPLDRILYENNIHDCDFIKIDTEGFENHIINGGKRIITENVLGVLCEVYFNPVRTGGAKFGDIHNALEDCGLSLYELNPSKICKKEFFRQKKNAIIADSMGQLVWGDAVFLRDPLKAVNASSFTWDLEKYKKLLSLYEIFNLDDCAYELVCYLEDKHMLPSVEIKKLKKVFLHKAFKVRLFNYIYNRHPFVMGLVPKRLKKILRKIA